MTRRFLSLVVFVLGCGLALTSGPAWAQNASANVETVKGPGAGERTSMSLQPVPVKDGLSMRAIGVDGMNGSRWAFSVIGRGLESITFRADGDPIEPLRVARPEGIGPTKVYLSQEDFFALSSSPNPVVLINGVATPIPPTLKADMARIYKLIG